MFNDFISPNNRYIHEEIFEEKDGYRLLVEMAGFKKENVSIESDGNFLIIEAERKPQENKPSLKQTKISRKYRVDSNTLATERVKASLEDGVLDIFIPKQLKKTNKRIEIQ